MLLTALNLDKNPPFNQLNQTNHCFLWYLFTARTELQILVGILPDCFNFQSIESNYPTLRRRRIYQSATHWKSKVVAEGHTQNWAMRKG